MNLDNSDNIICFVDNIISSTLCKNIQEYERIKDCLDIYSNLDILKLNGKVLDDVNRDIAYINELKFSKNIYFLYKQKTSQIIKDFLKILKTPMDNKSKDSATENKKNLVYKYLNTISLYIPYTIFKNISVNLRDNNGITANIDNYCENCKNITEFLKDNDVLICKNCYSEVIKLAYYNNRSYNFNAVKCNYDRTGHFKECLKQFQGKQNTFVNPLVYKNLETALLNNGMISADKNISKEDRYKNVTKSHVLYFLKELGYVKHYDDFILIHSNLTGQKPNDISHLEEVLISDFQKISEKYSKLYNSTCRKNFINIQYILYKLLCKHNYQFIPEDFGSIKSTDKKIERDEIFQKIASED